MQERLLLLNTPNREPWGAGEGKAATPQQKDRNKKENLFQELPEIYNFFKSSLFSARLAR